MELAGVKIAIVALAHAFLVVHRVMLAVINDISKSMICWSLCLFAQQDA